MRKQFKLPKKDIGKKSTPFKVGIMYSETRELVYFGITSDERYEFVEKIKSEEHVTSWIRSWIMDNYSQEGDVSEPRGLYYSKIYRGNEEHDKREEVWNLFKEELVA